MYAFCRFSSFLLFFFYMQDVPTLDLIYYHLRHRLGRIYARRRPAIPLKASADGAPAAVLVAPFGY